MRGSADCDMSGVIVEERWAERIDYCRLNTSRISIFLY